MPVPANFGEAEVLGLLENQGYTRLFQRIAPKHGRDRAGQAKSAKKKASKKKAKSAEEEQRERRPGNDSGPLPLRQHRARASDRSARESALRVGRGRVAVHVLEASNGSARSSEGESAPPAVSATWRFSSDLHCADCDIHYREPTPSLFSFNSPLGACDSCRGFGRIIGIDFGRIIPDQSKTLKGGAIRPWQTESYRECQDDLIKYARKRNIPVDVPWRDLTEQQRQWVLEGEGSWEDKVWYGVRRFFAWLETKSYKMHVRVLLSKYRAYTPCTVCDGARLKTDALLWRLGTKADAKAVLPDNLRFKPTGVQWNDQQLTDLPGIGIHELMLLPIDRCKQFFDRLALPAPLDEASDLVLREIRGRFGYLLDVGLGYLTLDRQSRTLSGGEVQRINSDDGARHVAGQHLVRAG